jgi:hypothetical protein
MAAATTILIVGANFSPRQQLLQGPIFCKFFLGKILGKIPFKIFPHKIVVFKKFRGIFCEKGFSAEKNVRKIGPSMREPTCKNGQNL